VLNGLFIDESVLKRQPLKLAQDRSLVLKKYALTLFISIVFHVLLLMLLSTLATQPQQEVTNANSKAIKSYLYKKTTRIENTHAVQVELIERAESPLKTPLKEELLSSETKTKAIAKVKSPNVVPSLSQKMREVPKTAKKSPVFSSYKQLDNLRSAINEKIIADQLSLFKQFRSASIMHGEQISVPRSEKQLTPAQQRKKHTTPISDSISMTKGDNGVCTLERKQFLGSPVEASSSTFNCGESKFDKSFREHMKKVQKKLIPLTQ